MQKEVDLPEEANREQVGQDGKWQMTVYSKPKPLSSLG